MRVDFVLVRRIVAGLTFGLAAAAPLLLSACQGSQPGYLQYGIGAQLPATDMPRATQLQETYFKHLCQQAGSPQNCLLPLYDEITWTLIVQQGMNDIDRRCDAYLQWLDNKKRSRGPLIAQSNAISATTQAIIQIASPGSAAISIVGLAFGLLNQSIENYHSRLLLEVESSTINSVVLRARHDFRAAVRNNKFFNRPDAEYALREYLKRCLPFAIETQINDLSTLGSRGISTEQDNTIFQAPVGTAPVKADTAVTTRPGPPPRQWAPGGWETVSTITIDVATAKQIQRAICLPEIEIDGTFGDKTEAGLRIFESIRASGGLPEDNWRSSKVDLSRSDLNVLRNVTACAPGAQNYLENQILTGETTSESQFAEKIRTKFNVSDASLGIAGLREQIELWRREANLENGPRDMFKGQITPDLVTKMFQTF